MIKRFDAVVLKKLRPEIDRALEEVGKKHGITIKAMNGSYLDQNASFKVEMAIVLEDGTVMTREASDFKRYASLYELKPEDLGREFKERDKTWKIVGVKPSSRLAIVCEDVATGKRYKLDPVAVVRGLKALEVKS